VSLDETFDRMRVFAAALDRFDEAMQASVAELKRRHEAASPLWQDAFARDYQAAWAPLEEGLERWCRHEGPQYRDFVAARMRALARYLDGAR
jgi:hypothetical protein